MILNRLNLSFSVDISVPSQRLYGLKIPSLPIDIPSDKILKLFYKDGVTETEVLSDNWSIIDTVYGHDLEVVQTEIPNSADLIFQVDEIIEEIKYIDDLQSDFSFMLYLSEKEYLDDQFTVSIDYGYEPGDYSLSTDFESTYSVVKENPDFNPQQNPYNQFFVNVLDITFPANTFVTDYVYFRITLRRRFTFELTVSSNSLTFTQNNLSFRPKSSLDSTPINIGATHSVDILTLGYMILDLEGATQTYTLAMFDYNDLEFRQVEDFTVEDTTLTFESPSYTPAFCSPIYTLEVNRTASADSTFVNYPTFDLISEYEFDSGEYEDSDH